MIHVLLTCKEGLQGTRALARCWVYFIFSLWWIIVFFLLDYYKKKQREEQQRSGSTLAANDHERDACSRESATSETVET